MARIDTSSAKCLYFCGVKPNKRHEVAGSASVFRAHNLVVENYKRIECGSSNAHKVSACLDLTARNALSLCQNQTI
jgi:hypothetical protein